MSEPETLSIVALSEKLSAAERREVFDLALKQVLPRIGSTPEHIVLAQVLIILKLEGIISEELESSDFDLVRVVKNAFLKDPVRVNEAVKLARKALK